MKNEPTRADIMRNRALKIGETALKGYKVTLTTRLLATDAALKSIKAVNKKNAKYALKTMSKGNEKENKNMKNLFAGLTVLAVAGATFGAASYYVYKKLMEADETDYEDIIFEDDTEKAYEDEVYEAAGLKEEKAEPVAEKPVEAEEVKEEATETEAPAEEKAPAEECCAEAGITESAKAVAEDAKEFAKTVAEAAEKKVSELTSEEKIDEIRGAVADFYDKASEFADNAFDRAEEVGSTVAEAAVKLYSDVKEIVEKKEDK